MISRHSFTIYLYFQILLLIYPHCLNAWNILLDSHVKTCFFENLNVTDRLGVNFELDPESSRQRQVDLEIFDSSGQLALDVKDETFGTYYIKAKADGRHHICFTSKGNVKLGFNILGGHPADANPASSQYDKDPVLEGTEQVKLGVRSIQDEHAYILLRERVHSKVAEGTSTKLLWWSILQCILLLGSCAWQIYYLKRFFEVKRVI